MHFLVQEVLSQGMYREDGSENHPSYLRIRDVSAFFSGFQYPLRELPHSHSEMPTLPAARTTWACDEQMRSLHVQLLLP